MTDQIRSGIELMFAGMGIVFVFLTMLVFAINLMSALVQRYFPEASAKIHDVSGSLDKSAVAAIAAAVHQYRNKNG
jgi:oxaloacetate decarboxylase (Na+ extruding) subunit gamma